MLQPVSVTEDFSHQNILDVVPIVSPVVDKFADFAEDPFSNYRYEDLANISDPFNDNI